MAGYSLGLTIGTLLLVVILMIEVDQRFEQLEAQQVTTPCKELQQ